MRIRLSFLRIRSSVERFPDSMEEEDDDRCRSEGRLWPPEGKVLTAEIERVDKPEDVQQSIKSSASTNSSSDGQ